jgi:hypothetical protein
MMSIKQLFGAPGSVVVKALCYKPEGHGFDSRWGEFLILIVGECILLRMYHK